MGDLGMASAIRLDTERFRKIAMTKAWVAPNGDFSFRAAARAIGCATATLTRIYHGEAPCGGQFIASLLAAATPWEFNDLFWVDADHRPDRSDSDEAA